MDGVRAVHGVLLCGDVENVVVVAFLKRTAEVLTNGVVVGLSLSTTLGELTNTSTVEVGHSAGDLAVAALAGLGVVVAEGAGITDILAGEVITVGALGEGLERSVAVLGLTSVPLGHTTGDVTVGDVGVGDNVLVHVQETVNVGVVEPEDGVEGRHVEVVHMATSLATSSIVDRVVDRLEAVDTAAAQVGADTNLRSRSESPRLLAGEESKDTVTERNAHSIETAVHLVVVRAGRVADRATESSGPAVPGTTAHLAVHGVTPAERVQRVGNLNTTLGLGDGNALVADQGWDGRLVLAWVLSPIPVGHAQSLRSVPPALLLVRGEVVDDLGDGEVPSLLYNNQHTQNNHISTMLTSKTAR